MTEQKKVVFKEGSYLYIEGDEDSQNIFIVQKGVIQLTSSNKNIDKYKKIVKPGDIFGFISSLSNRPRVESAIAIKDSIIIILSQNKFFELLQKQPNIAIKLINYFAEDLRTYDDMIFSGENSDANHPAHKNLFNSGKFYFEKKSYENAYYIFNRFTHLYPANEFIPMAEDMLSKIRDIDSVKLPASIDNNKFNIYHDGQMIFCEDEPGDNLFVIKEGKVKISKINNSCEIMLSILKKGDIFGELAIVSDNPRNATAIAYGEVKLFVVNKDSLKMLLKSSPELLRKIFIEASECGVNIEIDTSSLENEWV